jgi:hypothetical protein
MAKGQSRPRTNVFAGCKDQGGESRSGTNPGAVGSNPAADTIFVKGPEQCSGPFALKHVAFDRALPIKRNCNIPGLHLSWISFNLNQIEGNPL